MTKWVAIKKIEKSPALLSFVENDKSPFNSGNNFLNWVLSHFVSAVIRWVVDNKKKIPPAEEKPKIIHIVSNWLTSDR